MSDKEHIQECKNSVEDSLIALSTAIGKYYNHFNETVEEFDTAYGALLSLYREITIKGEKIL